MATWVLIPLPKIATEDDSLNLEECFGLKDKKNEGQSPSKKGIAKPVGRFIYRYKSLLL